MSLEKEFEIIKQMDIHADDSEPELDTDPELDDEEPLERYTADLGTETRYRNYLDRGDVNDY